MLRLLKIEWSKIYYYRTARIFTILYFAILVAIGLILAFIKPEVGGMKLDIAKLGMFNFPEVWQNITYLVAIAKIFIAVIIITNVTNEYSNRTLKQNLIDGMTKKEFLGSKFLTNVFFAFLSTLFVFGITLILGLVFSDNKENIFEGVEFVGAYFLKLNLFFSICLFLAILLRKSAFAFLGLIVLWIAEGAISTIEMLIKIKTSGVENLNQDANLISSYLPLNTSSNLIRLPNFNPNGLQLGGSVFEINPIDPSFVYMAILYIVIFTFLSYRLLKKRDL